MTIYDEMRSISANTLDELAYNEKWLIDISKLNSQEVNILLNILENDGITVIEESSTDTGLWCSL
jgi:hypothetical protein